MNKEQLNQELSKIEASIIRWEDFALKTEELISALMQEPINSTSRAKKEDIYKKMGEMNHGMDSEMELLMELPKKYPDLITTAEIRTLLKRGYIAGKFTSFMGGFLGYVYGRGSN